MSGWCRRELTGLENSMLLPLSGMGRERGAELRSLPRGHGKLPMGSARLCCLCLVFLLRVPALSPLLQGEDQDAGGTQAR